MLSRLPNAAPAGASASVPDAGRAPSRAPAGFAEVLREAEAPPPEQQRTAVKGEAARPEGEVAAEVPTGAPEGAETKQADAGLEPPVAAEAGPVPAEPAAAGQAAVPPAAALPADAALALAMAGAVMAAPPAEAPSAEGGAGEVPRGGEASASAAPAPQALASSDLPGAAPGSAPLPGAAPGPTGEKVLSPEAGATPAREAAPVATAADAAPIEAPLVATGQATAPSPDAGLAPPVPATSPHQALAAAAPMEAPPATRSYATAIPAQQVAPVIVAQLAKGGDASRLIVQLRPAELGGVEVAVEGGRDGATQVRITVERPETLALLNRDRGAIEQALQEAGIQAKPETLSLNLGDPGQRDGQAGAQASGQQADKGGGEGRRGPALPWGRQAGHAAETTAIPPPRLLARGLLDLAL